MRSIYLFACIIGLSACADQPPPTLDEQLAGKTPAQRERILRIACLNESEHIGNPPRKTQAANRTYPRKDAAQTRRFKELCSQMEDAGDFSDETVKQETNSNAGRN